MVYRIYVEKREGLQNEADALCAELRNLLGLTGITKVRLFNRYDVEGLSEAEFRLAVRQVLSEPQLDLVYDALAPDDGATFAVEYLPGQFDQRADSASQCIQILTAGERPLVRSAVVYRIYGSLSEDDLASVRKYVINPVEARLASDDLPETLAIACAIPETVRTLDGFCGYEDDALAAFVTEYGLAMDLDDIRFCRDYFRSENRDPTITEIRMIDTYWSDHCRHTTFLTQIDAVRFADPQLEASYQRYLDVRKSLGRTKPVCLMDIATLAVKELRAQGKLDKLDESEEINACTVKIDVDVDGVSEPWLLLFKNETHNHPTEIEPFGGAATCIGGAIRDPLSGRSYVYGAMRVTGAADPTVPVSETIPGKLPQRKIVTTAAAGYSSYGNQIGLATGIVDELYHPGYAAKRMEIGAVVAAAPAANVRRECPQPGDVVILLGGATGRDGIGGATGSSKAHNVHSVETCGAEVQKGNAPEERKLQRLFRNPEACRMIKRCNDFGAGGVSVAIGELADGLDICLDVVPKKYEGLDGTELAISESQERMAVVVSAADTDPFLAIADRENLSAVPVAVVKADPRLTMTWNGATIVDVSREFLNSNGAPKHIEVSVQKAGCFEKQTEGAFAERIRAMVSDLNCCSKQGLSERFDSTIGAGTVLMPFGGIYQRTPIQAMVQKVSVERGHTDDCSLMAWGYNPMIAEKSPYHGAYLAVVESVSKLIASGADFSDVYLSFQEYFARPGKDAERWGAPLAALLGAFDAQMDFGIGAIGGKDSMSGSFESIDVPPTLVSFAVTTGKAGQILSPEFKGAGHRVVLLRPDVSADRLPDPASVKKLFGIVSDHNRRNLVLACYTPGYGGIAEAVYKMTIGNGFGFRFADTLSVSELFDYAYGGFVLELADDAPMPEGAALLGYVTDEASVSYGSECVAAEELRSAYESRLESVFPTEAAFRGPKPETVSSCAPAKCVPPAVRVAVPRVLIPAFPGTNCEYDTAKAWADAGAEPEVFVIRNRSAEAISRSIEAFAEAVKRSQIIMIPGGFSGGDEPDGSGKFITAFFRNAAVKEAVTGLLDDRSGLMCGICNGFQALIKLGLVPYGKILDTDEHCPTLTFNTIARHQSRIVRTRIASTMSPWLSGTQVGNVYCVPISHGEGRFLADPDLIRTLAENGQIATQYVDLDGNATEDILYNPNGSAMAIEGITSPDGRVFGKMGHSERVGSGLYKNVPGDYGIGMFESAVRFFRKD